MTLFRLPMVTYILSKPEGMTANRHGCRIPVVHCLNSTHHSIARLISRAPRLSNSESQRARLKAAIAFLPSVRYAVDGQTKETHHVAGWDMLKAERGKGSSWTVSDPQLRLFMNFSKIKVIQPWLSHPLLIPWLTNKSLSGAEEWRTFSLCHTARMVV